MELSLGFPAVAASLALVAIVIGISRWKRLGLERDVLVASVRAGAQLLFVGLIFATIFSSNLAMLWAWLWIGLMLLMASAVIVRRAQAIPNLLPTSLVAMTGTTGIVLAVVFGFRVLDFEPVELIVISGITIGNTLPSVVLGANRMSETLRADYGQVEALLALGVNGTASTHHLETQVLKSALTPQIERTKVVGLIALPGAMTGLLLAGVAPVDAVILQLIVMLLVLGSVATSVVVMTRHVARHGLTADLRIASWVRLSAESATAQAS